MGLDYKVLKSRYKEIRGGQTELEAEGRHQRALKAGHARELKGGRET